MHMDHGSVSHLQMVKTGRSEERTMTIEFDEHERRYKVSQSHINLHTPTIMAAIQ